MSQAKLQNILFKEDLNREDVIYLLEIDDQRSVEKIFQRADQVRKDCCGEEVHLRGVIEISNYCQQNCLYCALREENFSLPRYRMEPDEIIETAKKIARSGIYTIVLQSGEDSTIDVDILSYIIYSIKNSVDVAITLSFGERGFDEYRAWKIAGADRYLLKHETCNEKLYSIYRDKKFLIDRIQHLKYLKRLGYQIGSGNIIGLPLQTTKDIADDILLLREMAADIVDINQFIPYPFTPYQNQKPGNYLLTLKSLAVSRIVLKNTHIHNLNIIKKEENIKQNESLSCGANVILTDFTPSKYNRNNQLKPGPVFSKSLKTSVESLGRNISFSKGDTLKSFSSISS
ncbi:MAG: radical SAM protein [Melioribacteraceae bacterium]|nr:radical SAM protein [Melioribacteraceae bacterium]